MSTKKRVQEFIQTRLLGAKMTIEEDTSLFEGGILDSMNLTELISFLEQEWRIKVSPSEVCLENFNTISNLVRFVEHPR